MVGLPTMLILVDHTSNDQWDYMIRKFKAFKIDLWVGLAALVVGGTLATLSVMRFQAYNAGMFDLGNMVQSIWSTTQGRPLEFTHGWETVSRLSIHVELFYFLLSPLYAIFPSPATLLIFQALLYSAGAFPLFGLAKRKLDHIPMARLIVLIYLLYPVGISAVLFDFHGDTLAAPLLLFAFNALDRRSWWGYGVWLVLALSCKFYVALPVCILGIILHFTGERRIGMVTAVSAVLWAGLTLLIIRPYFALQDVNLVHSTLTGYVGHYFGRTAELLTSSELPARLLVIFIVLLPAMWLGYRAVKWWLPALAIVIPAVMSKGLTVSSFGFRFHHYAIAVPFLMAAVVFGASSLREQPIGENKKRQTKRSWKMETGMTFALTLLFTVILIDIPLNPLFWISPPGWGNSSIAYGRTERDAFRDQWLAKNIPEDAAVLANPLVAPHLINRESIYIFSDEDGYQSLEMQERLRQVDFVIADAIFDYAVPDVTRNQVERLGIPKITTLVGSGHPTALLGGVLHDVPYITAILADPAFSLIDSQDGLLLFQRDAPTEHALQQEISVTSSKSRISGPYLAEYDNGLALLSAEIRPIDANRIYFRFEWYVTADWVAGQSYFAVSHIDGLPSGRIVHLPSLAILPTTEWSAGDLVIVEFENLISEALVPGIHRIMTGWYDPYHLFAEATDERSQVGVEFYEGTFRYEP